MDKSQEILDAAKADIIDRSATRDDDTGKSMVRTVDIFDKLTGNELSPRDGWLFMACVKIARSQQGKFHIDDYTDAASYIALAGEAAYGEVRPSRNGPSGCKNVRKDESDVYGPNADSTEAWEKPMVDLSELPGSKTEKEDTS